MTSKRSTADAVDTTAPSPRGRRRAPRWARVLLLVGLVASGWWLFGAAPRERVLALELARPAQVGRIEMAWMDGQQTLQHTVLQFEPGQAPRVVRWTVRAAPGAYRLRVMTQRASVRHETEQRIEVRGDTTEVRLPIR